MPILVHTKVSALVDGVDPGQIQPSDWNASHVLTGGSNGQILVRDATNPDDGAQWTSSPLVASLLFGLMVAPSSPADGEVWFEASGTFGVDRLIRLMARDGGVSYELWSRSIP